MHFTSKIKNYILLYKLQKKICVKCKKSEHLKHTVQRIKEFWNYVNHHSSIFDDLDKVISHFSTETKEKLKFELNKLYTQFYNSFKQAIQIENFIPILSFLNIKTTPIKFTNILYKNIELGPIFRIKCGVKKLDKVKKNFIVISVLVFNDEKIGILFNRASDSFFHIYDHLFCRVLGFINFRLARLMLD